MSGFEVAGIVIEGHPIVVRGLNPWQHEWHRLSDEPVELPHPAYPSERHKMWLYEIHKGNKRVKFAAGELSVNVWGFYVPTDS
jgi:hypothetical protein